jgi:serine/threonine protein kinase
LTKNQLIKIIFDILRGLAHLAKHHVIHGDLKFQNILMCSCTSKSLSSLLTSKIADFGLAQFQLLNQVRRQLIQSLTYRAPEVILGSKWYTTAVDMWSLGIMICQAVYGRVPSKQRKSAIRLLTEQVHCFGGPPPAHDSHWVTLIRSKMNDLSQEGLDQERKMKRDSALYAKRVAEYDSYKQHRYHDGSGGGGGGHHHHHHVVGTSSTRRCYPGHSQHIIAPHHHAQPQQPHLPSFFHCLDKENQDDDEDEEEEDEEEEEEHGQAWEDMHMNHHDQVGAAAEVCKYRAKKLRILTRSLNCLNEILETVPFAGKSNRCVEHWLIHHEPASFIAARESWGIEDNQMLLDLVGDMLIFNPNKRITPKRALLSPLFKKYGFMLNHTEEDDNEEGETPKEEPAVVIIPGVSDSLLGTTTTSSTSSCSSSMNEQQQSCCSSVAPGLQRWMEECACVFGWNENTRQMGLKIMQDIVDAPWLGKRCLESETGSGSSLPPLRVMVVSLKPLHEMLKLAAVVCLMMAAKENEPHIHETPGGRGGCITAVCGILYDRKHQTMMQKQISEMELKIWNELQGKTTSRALIHRLATID